MEEQVRQYRTAGAREAAQRRMRRDLATAQRIANELDVRDGKGEGSRYESATEEQGQRQGGAADSGSESDAGMPGAGQRSVFSDDSGSESEGGREEYDDAVSVQGRGNGDGDDADVLAGEVDAELGACRSLKRRRVMVEDADASHAEQAQQVQERQQPVELTFEELCGQLDDALRYLREEHSYCLYCGCVFDNATLEGDEGDAAVEDVPHRCTAVHWEDH